MLLERFQRSAFQNITIQGTTQLTPPVVFEAEDCAYCKQFKAEVLDHWQSPVAIKTTLNPNAPTGWKMDKPLFATPTIVLFEKGKEVARHTGYSDKAAFWKWLGMQAQTPGQQKLTAK